ncbi:major capsid protein [Pandoraea cepalis]|uniref:Phage-related membrane protein n=1 Tax=Pandoraea cepalis TaxID=2508294 RepID=A0A5E4XSZ3_9BURK|nr:major capsid protein [Pandoraea cepalis]VVE39202.1 hypothetical protein PCE31107_04067 [Pandoraea cepalis]
MKEVAVRLKPLASKVAVALSLATISAMAFAADAAPIDVSQLTSKISFAGVVASIMAVGGLMAGVYVALKSARVILGMIRNA